MSNLESLLIAPFARFDGDITPVLEEAGLPSGAPLEWAIDHAPEALADAHRAYQGAGASIVRTDTFCANAIRLGTIDQSVRCVELNTSAVRIARNALDDGTCLAGLIGPTGAMLPPAGTARKRDIEYAYEVQIGSLSDAGVDALHLDQMISLQEASIALKVCQKITKSPVLVTLALVRGRRGFVTPAGDAAGDALQTLVDSGARVVGASGGLDSASMAPLAGAMRAFLDAPLAVLPTAGAAMLTLEGQSYPDTPETFAIHGRAILKHGVRLIGGACGTTPAHIAALTPVLEDAQSDNP